MKEIICYGVLKERDSIRIGRMEEGVRRDGRGVFLGM